MKKLFSFFGPVLSILLGISLLVEVALPFIGMNTSWLYDFNQPTKFGDFISFILIVSFFLSVLYLLIGLTGLIVDLSKKQKNANEGSRAKKLILRGVIGGVVSVILFFIIQVELGFFGLSLNSSFSGDTLVKTPQGYKKIAELKEGSQVLSYNTKTKLLQTEAIEVYRFHNVTEYFLINNTLKVTSEHPFAIWQDEKIVWKPVKELALGDVFVTSSNERMIVKTKEKVSVEQPIRVYNPQVSGQHNYFVLLNGTHVLVHNKLPKLPEE